MDEVRIVLLGKQGAGKSSSGNTLLGQNLFKTAAHTDRVTQTCSEKKSAVDNQSIMVVDTPGWPDSLFETEIMEEIMKCIDMCRPHVFLLVLPIGRFTNDEINTVSDIMKEFGNEAFKHMILLFTRGDDLEGKSIEDYLENTHQDLKNILEKCLGGHHVFNNRDKSNQNQVSSLLQKINHMVDKNDKSYYTKIMNQNLKDQQREDEECLKDKNYLALDSEIYEIQIEKATPHGQKKKETDLMMPKYKNPASESNLKHRQHDDKMVRKEERSLKGNKFELWESNMTELNINNTEVLKEVGLLKIIKFTLCIIFICCICVIFIAL